MATFQREREGARMLSVEEAQGAVLGEVTALGSETIPFRDARGRVLAEDVEADGDAPERDNSAMDGYAVRAADLPGSLRVIDDIRAGVVPSVRVEAGTAARIMTGALVPDGADTVVQVEWTNAGEEIVEVRRAPAAGANIRRRGSDRRAGEVVLRRGVRIGAGELAMLAGVRKRQVEVGRRPTVAILSTGDELLDVDQERRPGTIVNTNATLLGALVEEAGGIPQQLGIVRDDLQSTIAALSSAVASDFVVSSGGVSVGAYDFVKDALDALGAETKFWQIAMKPGKPVVLSKLRDRVVFGLPGNPVSCFVSFHLFVAPALRKASGQDVDLFPPAVNARIASPLRAGERRVYYRVQVTAVDGELQATPNATQGSGALTSMVGANGLAVVQPNTVVDAGALAPVLLIGPVSGR